MRVYRLIRERYKDELSGYGASLFGQRWNSAGTEVVYTAESRALATAEVAVHLPLGIMPKDFHMVCIDIPDLLPILLIPPNDLPPGWDAIPHLPLTQSFGDRFVQENTFAVMKVSSVVVKGDFNYVMNPRHPAFSSIRILETELFPFDPRFFR